MQHQTALASHGRRHRFVAVAAIVLTATSLVACGSDRGDAGGAKATTPPAATAGDDGTTTPATDGSGSTSPDGTDAGGGSGGGSGGSGGGGGSDVSGLGIDACSLLSDDDITAAFASGGSALTITSIVKTNQDSPGTGLCNIEWTASNESNSSFGLFVYGPDVYAGLKAASDSQAWDPLPGAFETFDGPFYGNDKVTVSIVNLDSDDVTAVLLKAAADHAA